MNMSKLLILNLARLVYSFRISISYQITRVNAMKFYFILVVSTNFLHVIYSLYCYINNLA